ncbi:MAG: hypothetical protein ACYCQJ_03615 [Nitrososphaerales archaeon]
MSKVPLEPKRRERLSGAVLVFVGLFLIIASLATSTYTCFGPGQCIPPFSFYLESNGLLTSGIACLIGGVYFLVRK